MDNCIGGAMDVNAFRDNIGYGQRPDLSSLTYEGLFAEYYFDTKTNKKNQDKDDENKSNETEQLINPTYCYAKTKKPKSLIKSFNLLHPKNDSNTNDDTKEDSVIMEYFMTVGLNETFDVNKLKRNKLNLLIVLDHSGSMGSPFSYHDKDKNITKMAVANKAVISLLVHLNDNDRLGIIKFDSKATVVQKLNYIKDINIEQLKANVANIKEEGGTNMETAYRAATNMYKQLFSTTKKLQTNDNEKEKIKHDISPKDKYSNRIIFLTDAMPNSGATDPNSLLGMMENNALDTEHPVFTTFIGIGLDFNTLLIDQITKVNGANYYSVHSNEEFMVTPLLFNFVFTLLAEGNSCCIAASYGTGDDEKAVSQNGELMNVKTLFPSAHDNDDQVKGGVVVLKLRTNDKDNNINYNMEITVTYQDIEGKQYKIDDTIMFGGVNKDNINKNGDTDYFDNNGIRKSILLVRYVQLLKEWMNYEEQKKNTSDVSDEYKKIFVEFKKYFESEIKKIGDDSLKKEIEILDKLIQWKTQ